MRRRALAAAAGVLVVLAAGCTSSPPRTVRVPSGGPSASGSGATTAPTTGAQTDGASDGGFANVAIGGGGFVTGLSISDDGATRVVRTDVSGGYRWDASADSGAGGWVWDTSSTSLPADDVKPGLGSGVLAVAVAPGDASRVYMAYNDAVYRSDDAAGTWTKVLSSVSTAPNDDFRTTGPRLVVDPADPDVVYYGSQLQGLYETRDAGAHWTTIGTGADGVPRGLQVDTKDKSVRGDIARVTDKGQGTKIASAGINAIVVDPAGGSVDGRAKVVYAASYGNGVYRSTDGGDTWAKDSPAAISAVGYLRALGDGDLLLTSHSDPTDQKGDADVWRRHDGQWSLSGPQQGDAWKGVAVDPTTPGRVALMAPGGQLALSGDDAKTWTLVARVQDSTGDVPWLANALNQGTHYMSPAEIVFDPVVPGRLWLTEGTGVWYADLGKDASPTSAGVARADASQAFGSGQRVITWHSQTRGIDELVPTGVIAPPGGKPILTSWDRAIFRSEDPTRFPDTYGPDNKFNSAWSIDWSVTDPNYLVADVASHQYPSDPSESGYSTDGGKTWTPFPSIPLDSTNAVKTFGFGAMAVSTPGNVVWAPAYGRRPYYTKDGGKTWQPITLPGVSDYRSVYRQAYYVNHQVLTADKATPGTFYLYVNKVGTFRTVDGGDTWTQMSDDSAMRGTDYGYAVRLKAVPDHAGELYLTPGLLPGSTEKPLLHSTDGGASWTAVSGVTGVTAFGFGAAFAGQDHPAIFIAGYVDGTYGIYRSTDDAESWTLLTTYPAGRMNNVVAIDGDKSIQGRLYLAVGGSSLVYGG